MSAITVELLDLIVRWVHVIAGIMWVGNSLLFNWLDRSLEKSAGPGLTREPIGTIWLLHSGGFYYVEKTLLGGAAVPRPLHWFKWQAYTTWLSGALLLVVLYYASDRAVLADPAVARLSHASATVVAVAAIIAGWAAYELPLRFVAPRAPAAAIVLWIIAFVAIVVALTQLLSGRAAFLHAGAMLGTIMAANVAHTIVPSQRKLVASVAEGGRADPVISDRAKRVSIHNNYLTFPVIALMVSSHFPSLYSHRWNWLVLLLVCAGGALVRHIMNVRFTYARWKPALAGTVVAGSAALYALVAVPGSRRGEVAASPGLRTVEIAEVRSVIDRRCTTCHSAQPADRTLGVAPGGVTFDTPDQIRARAPRIFERAVVTRTMPPANRTGMTPAERELLSRWFRQMQSR